VSEMDDPIFTMWLPARRGIDRKTGKECWINEPMGKGRPRGRIVRQTGKPDFISFYPDPESAKYEAAIAEAAACEWRRPALNVALTAYVEVFVPIPASWSRRKQEDAAAGNIHAMSKPDGDNYQKIVGDALNKIVWSDDSIIVNWQCLKVYSFTPGLRVSVWLWDDMRPTQGSLL